MWTVPMPTCSAADAYETCITGVRDSTLKDRFDAAVGGVDQADRAYRKAGVEAALGVIDQADFVLEGLTVADMSRLYGGRMARKLSPGRPIYDQIRMASKYDLCPYCGHRNVMTVDHYLPKALFPALAVNPANLIPVCTDCNTKKSSLVIDLLHPYFDDIEDDVWLRAEVIEEAPPAVRFQVSPPSHWPDELTARVHRHFELFELDRIYSLQAAVTMSGDRLQLERLLQAVGWDGVRNELVTRADSRRSVNVNSWQVALYDALAASTWYCTGGFRF
jgi:HNH endonuclease